MILAQLSVYPIGEGTSLSRFVKKGVKVVRESGFTCETGGLSTAIEVPDLDSLFLLVKRCTRRTLMRELNGVLLI